MLCTDLKAEDMSPLECALMADISLCLLFLQVPAVDFSGSNRPSHTTEGGRDVRPGGRQRPGLPVPLRGILLTYILVKSGAYCICTYSRSSLMRSPRKYTAVICTCEKKYIHVYTHKVVSEKTDCPTWDSNLQSRQLLYQLHLHVHVHVGGTPRYIHVTI